MVLYFWVEQSHWQLLIPRSVGQGLGRVEDGDMGLGVKGAMTFLC